MPLQQPPASRSRKSLFSVKTLQGILLAIPLELQGKKRQPFFMAQPLEKGRWMRPAYREAVKKRMRFWARPRHGMWLFYLYSMLKIQFFIQIFAEGLHDWGIFWGIPLEFQEIRHQPLLWHSLWQRLCHSNRLICCCMQFLIDAGEIFLPLSGHVVVFLLLQHIENTDFYSVIRQWAHE